MLNLRHDSEPGNVGDEQTVAEQQGIQYARSPLLHAADLLPQVPQARPQSPRQAASLPVLVHCRVGLTACAVACALHSESRSQAAQMALESGGFRLPDVAGLWSQLGAFYSPSCRKKKQKK